MQKLAIVSAWVVAVAGCGNIYHKGARNAAQADFSTHYRCPKNEIKTSVITMKRDGENSYQADVNVKGCGKDEVWDCTFYEGWACAPKKH